jgi:hypothetical protein
MGGIPEVLMHLLQKAQSMLVFLICLSLTIGLLVGCKNDRYQASEMPTGILPANTLAQKTPTLALLEADDGGLLYGKPCGPPCFYNISPELTTEEEAEAILGRYYDIRSACLPWRNADSHGLNCDSIWVGFDADHSVYSLDWIPSRAINVGEIIELHGDPDGVDIIGLSPNGANTMTTTVVVKLYWNNIYTRIDLPEQEGMNYDLDPSTQIASVHYSGKAKWEIWSKMESQAWHGFGRYQGPYWAGP